jgi:sugar phosphate isomerase/epimerase
MRSDESGLSRELAGRLCAIGDEAGAALDDQITAIGQLGWPWIELRSVDKVALAELDETRFERLLERLSYAQLRVPVVCSRIGSWFGQGTRTFADDLAELAVLAPRLLRLGAQYLRVMSYPALAIDDAAARTEVIARMQRLGDAARETGLVLLHENCVGWAGGSHPERVLELIDAVGADVLRVLFDVGNGLAYGYGSLGFLAQVLPYVAHVHIKDGIEDAGEVHWGLPGRGQGQVRACVDMLLHAGYAGLFSIEPHLLTVPHLGRQAEGAVGIQRLVEHGRCFARLLGAASLEEGAA